MVLRYHLGRERACEKALGFHAVEPPACTNMAPSANSVAELFQARAVGIHLPDAEQPKATLLAGCIAR